MSLGSGYGRISVSIQSLHLCMGIEHERIRSHAASIFTDVCNYMSEYHILFVMSLNLCVVCIIIARYPHSACLVIIMSIVIYHAVHPNMQS